MSRNTDDRALFSIGMAAKLSGVPVETIRTWERRYGVLEPVRTAGGHRKYTARDVETLRSLRAMTDQGYRIGAMPADLDALSSTLPSPPVTAAPDVDPAWVERTLAAARALRIDDLERQLSVPWQAGDVAHAIRAMLAALHEAGQRWHEGRLEIAAEHALERSVTKRLHSAFALLPRPRGADVAILAAPPGELHEVALLAAALVCHEEGVAVTYLGANLPVDELERALLLARPRFVILGVTVPLDDDTLSALARVLDAARRHGTDVVLGGQAAGAVARSAHDVTVVESMETLRSTLRARLDGAGRGGAPRA